MSEARKAYDWFAAPGQYISSREADAFYAGYGAALRLAQEVVEKADDENSCGSGCGSAVCVWEMENLVERNDEN